MNDQIEPLNSVPCPSGASPRRLYRWALVLGTAAVLAIFWIDVPAAEFCLARRVPGELRKLVTLSEVFAHGWGVGAILLAVFVLDSNHRRNLLRLGACAFAPSLCNFLLKLSVARQRPNQYRFGNTIELPTHALDTFVGWFPAATVSLERALDASVQSFASGHTASAVGLAIGLTWLYPHGRWLFGAFAFLAAMQRLESGAHYVSDVLTGAALACCVAGLCLHDAGPGRFFVSFETPRNDPQTAGRVHPPSSFGRSATASRGRFDE